jgi:hypothetical protein
MTMDAKKLHRGLLNTGLVISFCFGIWHFVIPYMFKWYSYIPDAPRELPVSIDWTNFFFSLLLTGLSLLLFIFRRKIETRDITVFSFFGLLVLTWLSRVLITIIRPWHIRYTWIDWVQLGVFVFECTVLVIPFVYFLRKKEE